MRSISGTSAQNRADAKGLAAITGDSASLFQRRRMLLRAAGDGSRRDI
jgi:hypothetical protein